MTILQRLCFIIVLLRKVNCLLGYPRRLISVYINNKATNEVSSNIDSIEVARNNPISYQLTPSIELGHRRTDLLLSIWEKVAFPELSDFGESIFKLSDYGLDRGSVKSLLEHFQNCKDCASDDAFLMATQDVEGNDILSLSCVSFPLVSGDSDGETFGNEDYSDILSEYNDELKSEEFQKGIFPIENDDNIVMRDTRQWVQSVIAGMQVCPFTIDPDKAGIPLGGVRYRVSRGTYLD